MALKDLISAGFSARQARRLLLEIGAGGGGGGSFGGTTVVNSGSRQVSAAGSGQRVAFQGWTSAPYATGKPGPAVTIDNPNFQWTPTLAGWYQIRWNLLVEFSASAPTFVRFEDINYYDNYGIIQDLPVNVTDATTGNGRQNPGFQGGILSNIFYTEDAATVGVSGVKPFLYWNGTPTLSRLFLTAEISKLG